LIADEDTAIDALGAGDEEEPDAPKEKKKKNKLLSPADEAPSDLPSASEDGDAPKEKKKKKAEQIASSVMNVEENGASAEAAVMLGKRKHGELDLEEVVEKPPKKSKKEKKSKKNKKSDGNELDPNRVLHCPTLDIAFEIAVPNAGSAEVECSPLLEEPGPATTGGIGGGRSVDEVLAELQQPYSVLRLRLKDRLERLIGSVKVEEKEEVAVPEKQAERKLKPLEQEYVLSLRERPGYTGGAYTMKGPTIDQAPFFGFKYDFTGSVWVKSQDAVRPAMYQPFRDDHEQPDHNRPKPTDAMPMGERSDPKEDDRLFNLVR